MSETITIRTPADRDALVASLANLSVPSTVTIRKGVKRSNEQNHLQRLWVKEISQQLGDQTTEEVRAFSKAMFGVPILCRDDDDYAEKYETTVKPLPPEIKLKLLAEPFDFAVTRLMNVKQKIEYLDAMYKYWTQLGIKLTEPKRRNG